MNHKISQIKVVPQGYPMNPGVPSTPEPRMNPRSQIAPNNLKNNQGKEQMIMTLFSFRLIFFLILNVLPGFHVFCVHQPYYMAMITCRKAQEITQRFLAVLM